MTDKQVTPSSRRRVFTAITCIFGGIAIAGFISFVVVYAMDVASIPEPYELILAMPLILQAIAIEMAGLGLSAYVMFGRGVRLRP